MTGSLQCCYGAGGVAEEVHLGIITDMRRDTTNPGKSRGLTIKQLAGP